MTRTSTLSCSESKGKSYRVKQATLRKNNCGLTAGG